MIHLAHRGAGGGDGDVPVEAAAADQCGVQPMRVVARTDYDDALALFDAVNFREQRIDHFDMPLRMVRDPRAVSKRVDLIDEQDGGGGLISCLHLRHTAAHELGGGARLADASGRAAGSGRLTAVRLSGR